MKYFFRFDRWFASKKAVEAVIEVGAKLIGMVKTNTKVFCKDTIENLKRYCPGGSYLVLGSKPMLPRYRPLIDIGYKYNAWKILSLLLHTKQVAQRLVFPAYIIILTNLIMLPLSLFLVPLLCQNKSAVNKVDSHNKSIHYDLALEKWLVTQCGWLWLYMTVAMGMTITNYWKLFCHGVKRGHNEKLIGIRKLSERLAQNCFNNTFSPDRGTPAKNIPPLDEVDGGDTVST